MCASPRCPACGSARSRSAAPARPSPSPAGRSAGRSARRTWRTPFSWPTSGSRLPWPRRSKRRWRSRSNKRRAVSTSPGWATCTRPSAISSSPFCRLSVCTRSSPTAPISSSSTPATCDVPVEPGARRDYAVCRWFTRQVGVAAIPPSPFYSEAHQHLTDNLARFTFCKTDDLLDEAARRLQAALG